MKTKTVEIFGNVKVLATLISLLLVLIEGNAIAEPMNGFSLNMGTANNTMAATLIANNNAFSYGSSGLSIGIDYQIAVSQNISLNPFLMSSSESTTGALTSGTLAGHGVFGLQLRYWMNDLYVGGHFGNYSEFLLNNANNPNSTGGAGGGGGLVVGWEPSKSKWYLMGQYDSANIAYIDTNVKLTGARISVGYRWK